MDENKTFCKAKKRYVIVAGIVTVILLFFILVGINHLLGRSDRIAWEQRKDDLLSVYDQLLRYEHENLELPKNLDELVPEYLRQEQLTAGGKPRYYYDRSKRRIALALGHIVSGLIKRKYPPAFRQLPDPEEYFKQQNIQIAKGKLWAPSGPAGESAPPGTLVFEAEHLTGLNYGWEIHPDPNCGGGAYAYSKEGLGNGPGQKHSKIYNFYDRHESKDYNYIRWHFKVPESGYYYIYGRIWTTGSHCSNCIIVGIDKAGPNRHLKYNGQSLSNRIPFRWVWTPASKRVKIEAGDHFLEAFLHEDGVRVDQFAISPVRLRGKKVLESFSPVNKDTLFRTVDKSPLLLGFDLKSRVITPSSPPECQLTIRKIRPATGKAIIKVSMLGANADGSPMLLGKYLLDLSSKQELSFFPIDFSKLNLKKLQRREYLLEAVVIRKKEIIAKKEVTLVYPMQWKVCGPFPLIPNGSEGPLDGDLEPDGKDSKTGKWVPFKESSFDLFGVLDFGLQTIGNSLHAPQNVTIYAKTEIECPETGEYLLKIQSDDQLLLWIDGKQVCRRDNRAPVTRSAQRLKLKITKGKHRIRMRVNQWQRSSYGDGRWQAYLRFRTVDDDITGVTSPSVAKAMPDTDGGQARVRGH
jgi:PA14 domain-containing protein